MENPGPHCNLGDFSKSDLTHKPVVPQNVLLDVPVRCVLCESLTREA